MSNAEDLEARRQVDGKFGASQNSAPEAGVLTRVVPADLAGLDRSNPIFEQLLTDDEVNESWVVDEYLRALDEYKNRPEVEFDADGDLRLATYHRVSRCGATPEQVDEAIATLEPITIERYIS